MKTINSIRKIANRFSLVLLTAGILFIGFNANAESRVQKQKDKTEAAAYVESMGLTMVSVSTNDDITYKILGLDDATRSMYSIVLTYRKGSFYIVSWDVAGGEMDNSD